MSSIAIITARGGSKRIPKKNIKEFCGKPIIAYSIEAALNSGAFDEVMVSTDSEEIKAVAEDYGAKVPFLRSDDTSNDYATTADVVSEVIDQYDKKGMIFDYICCIYPTAPFITSETLKQAVELLKKNRDADSVMPIVRYSFPPQRASVIKDGYLCYQYPQYANARSQDLEPIYHDCGQFYVCKLDTLRNNKDVCGPKTLPIEISEERVQDIDNISDWSLAELKYKVMMNSQKG